MIGVDEVGRGSLAGPLLVVAARQIGGLPSGLKDSKLMTRPQREKIHNKLSVSCKFGEGWVSPAEIDQFGLTKALRTGAERALDNLRASVDEEIILDGKTNYLPNRFVNGRCVVDADESTPIVSAASVFAKVARDNLMSKLAGEYPGYGFERHVGYGTAEHLKALESEGAIEALHRLSFAPVSKLMKGTL